MGIVLDPGTCTFKRPGPPRIEKLEVNQNRDQKRERSEEVSSSSGNLIKNPQSEFVPSKSSIPPSPNYHLPAPTEASKSRHESISETVSEDVGGYKALQVLNPDFNVASLPEEQILSLESLQKLINLKVPVTINVSPSPIEGNNPATRPNYNAIRHTCVERFTKISHECNAQDWTWTTQRLSDLKANE